MSFASLLSSYLTLNLLIIVLCVLLFSIQNITSARLGLRFHYWALLGLFIAVGLSAVLPRQTPFKPIARVWSVGIAQDPSNQGPHLARGVLEVPVPRGDSSFETDQAQRIFFVASVFVIAFGFLGFAREGWRLWTLVRGSYLIRRIGRVSILVNCSVHVPFSCWTPGRAIVVLPDSLVTRMIDSRIAIAHEIQHHRQKDTIWVYFVWSLRFVCWLNPFIHIWNRLLIETQEFAVDEALVDRKRVEPRQYARCLVEVAETALSLKRTLACATGMTFQIERNLLKRRVEKMILNQKRNHLSGVGIGAVLVALLVVTTYSSHGLVQDRHISRAEAEKWGQVASQDSDFPIVVNDLVLEQLNHYIGTPEGRSYMKSALARMENYRPTVESKMREYQVPKELLAIPIVESGYQNLSVHHGKYWVAGIWMFIAQTARNYGLRVDEQVDERMNSEILTDAAMRYLKGERLRFNDWLLAVLSYNIGENALKNAIRSFGTRDAWKLVRSGLKTDKNYLPRVIASMIIMKNPEVLK